MFNPEYKSPDLIKQQSIICEIKAENLLILMDYAILYLSNVFWKYARLCFLRGDRSVGIISNNIC